MKLLHIIASMDPEWGGVCQALKTTVKGLNNFAEVDNEILSFDDPHAVFITQNPDPVHALGPGKGPWFYNKTYIPWLVNNLARYDAVVLHGLWNYQGYGLIGALRVLRKQNASFTTRFFVMPHGMLDPYFQKAAGRKLKAARNWVYWKLLENKVIRQAEGLLFTCQAELELARSTFKPYQPKKEIAIGLGVDEPPAFNTEMQNAFLNKCKELVGKRYLLFLSRIHPKKGIDMLVNVYQTMSETKNNDTAFTGKKNEFFKLTVAGPGIETEYGRKIKNMADSAATADLDMRVVFPGMLTGDAKWGAFYAADAFVLPSHQENFGIAVVEALACGKPVLISDQVNIYKEILSAEAGIVAHDTIMGTEQLLQSWNSLSKEQRIEMGKNARKCYEKYFAVAPAAYNFLKAVSV